MYNKPIGIFDSGLGGLTALKEIVKLMPNENIVYFGDTSRVPYGSKSRETILNYSMQDISFLKSMNVKIIVAACGTVSSMLNEISNNYNTLFTGVLEPTCQAALRASDNHKIGVIGTTATIKSNSYKKLINKLDSSYTVYQVDCPLFVPMIEYGIINSDDVLVKETVKRHLHSFINTGIDTLILGCTHYPIISEAIQNEIGQNVKLIDSGKETARFVYNLLKDNNILSHKSEIGQKHFFVSDSTENFSRIANIFLGENFKLDVKKIDINQYSI